MESDLQEADVCRAAHQPKKMRSSLSEIACVDANVTSLHHCESCPSARTTARPASNTRCCRAATGTLPFYARPGRVPPTKAAYAAAGVVPGVDGAETQPAKRRFVHSRVAIALDVD